MDFEQLGFGDIFGDIEFNTVEEPKEKKVPKKAEKKEPKKAEKKAKAVLKASAFTGKTEFAAGRYLVVAPELPTDGVEIVLAEKTDESGFRKVLAEQYSQYKSTYFRFSEAKTAKEDVVVVLPVFVRPDKPAEELPLDAVLQYGMEACGLSNEAFDGADEEAKQLPLKDAETFLGSQRPLFSGTHLVYDPGTRQAYLTLKGLKQAGGGTYQWYRPEGSTEVSIKRPEDLLALMCDGLVLPAGVGIYAYASGDELVATFEAVTALSSATSKTAPVEKKPTMEEVRVPLPVDVFFAYRENMHLTPEEFGGRNEVPMKDIIAFVAKTETIFKTGTPDFKYIKEHNLVHASVLMRSKG